MGLRKRGGACLGFVLMCDRHVRVHHVDKDKDDPLLREVLAQRPEGGNRGRRRRISDVCSFLLAECLSCGVLIVCRCRYPHDDRYDCHDYAETRSSFGWDGMGRFVMVYPLSTGKGEACLFYFFRCFASVFSSVWALLALMFTVVGCVRAVSPCSVVATAFFF